MPEPLKLNAGPITGLPSGVREMGDIPATRKRIFDNTLAASQAFKPVSNPKYTMELADAAYEGPENYSKADEKRAILEGRSLGRRLRGTWRMRTNDPEQRVVDEKRVTLGNVPYMTPRGTFIVKGNEYNLSHQMRLRPGIFTRVKESGELESHVNVAKGYGHRYFLDPESGIFRIQLGQARMPLLPVLKALGATDSQIRKSWGNELYYANAAKAGTGTVRKFHKRMLNKDAPDDEKEMFQAIRDAFAEMELDPEVTLRTLGKAYSTVDPEVIMAATSKLLRVHRKEEDADDRDAMAFQRTLGPEDIFAERIRKGAGEARKALWKATFPGNLQRLQTGTFDKSIMGALLDTGLGSAIEEINPAELYDYRARVTRMGEGGIPSSDAVPDEARAVHPSQLGFIDPVHSPECFPADAKVMTSEGWVRFDTVTVNHEFACYINDKVEFNKPSRLIVEFYTGKLYGARNSITAYLVTPTHRLWVCDCPEEGDTEDDKEFRFETAEKAHSSGELMLHFDEDLCDKYRCVVRTQPENRYVMNYSGMVYCATVPGGLLLVKQDSARGMWTGNSNKIGIDTRLAVKTLKGDDGRLYSRFTDPKTGKDLWKTPQDVADAVVSFPGELESGNTHVKAQVDGKLKYVHRNKVDFQLGHMTEAFGPLASLVPLKPAAFGQRISMGSRMLTQALPIVDPEAPLVQSGIAGEDRSYEEAMGADMGALRSAVDGTVLEVGNGRIKIRGTDRKVHYEEMYENFPYSRKTFTHNTAVVKPGDSVKAGDLLARSNFTDAKGVTALGKNARVAYMPYKGYNFEDAIVISESFAKKMSSEHMYQHSLDLSEGVRADKNAFISIFPGKYKKELLDKYDDDGVIKPGQTVELDEPLLLAVKQRQDGPKLGRRQASWGDASVNWKHHAQGIVTDVYKGKKGINVFVKSVHPTEVGDKFCFDPETSLLTKTGWKLVADITEEDTLATLNPDTDHLEWQNPTHLHKYQHDGEMYKLQTKHLDMLVTPEHELWVCRPEEPYQKVKARDFYESKGEWQFKKDALWAGQEQALFTVPTIKQHTSLDNSKETVPMDVWLEFLGYYISEGRRTRTTGGGWQVQISQFTSSQYWQSIADCLDELGFRWAYTECNNRFEINSKQLYLALHDCGDGALSKTVPEYVQELSSRQLRIFFESYMDGDGHRGASWEYGTSSPQLSDDLSLVLLKIGWCGAPRLVDRHDNFQKAPHWRTRVNRKHLRPWWKKSRVNKYKSVVEEMVDYAGMVYCVTVPNHIVYTKRGEKSYWSLNSGRYG